MIDYIYEAHSHRILQWNDSILQNKLKENIIVRCLSTDATKFFKIVLNRNGYISCSAVCPFKCGKNIFFVKLFDFWVILSDKCSIGISVSQAYLDYISYSHVRQMVSVSTSVSTFMF